MDQKKSHNVTPKPDQMRTTRNPGPKVDRIREEEREQAIISPDLGKPKKKASRKGPLSVGVNFDHSEG